MAKFLHWNKRKYWGRSEKINANFKAMKIGICSNLQKMADPVVKSYRGTCLMKVTLKMVANIIPIDYMSIANSVGGSCFISTTGRKNRLLP